MSGGSKMDINEVFRGGGRSVDDGRLARYVDAVGTRNDQSHDEARRRVDRQPETHGRGGMIGIGEIEIDGDCGCARHVPIPP